MFLFAILFIGWSANHITLDLHMRLFVAIGFFGVFTFFRPIRTRVSYSDDPVTGSHGRTYSAHEPGMFVEALSDLGVSRQL